MGSRRISRPRVLASLLKDLLPDSPREAGVLIAAAEADLAGMLRGSLEHGLDVGTASKLAAGRLAQSSAFTPDACDWVSGELAVALGYLPPDAVRPGAPQATQRAAVPDYPPAQGAPMTADIGYPPHPASPRPEPYRPPDPGPRLGQRAGSLAPPPSIRRAVRLMYVGAALFGPRPGISAIDAGNARGQIVVYLLVALVSIVLWLWMAWASKRGRSWSRIVSAVLFAVATVILVASLVTPANTAGRLILFADWVIGLLAVVCQWQRPSSEYYRASRRPVSA